MCNKLYNVAAAVCDGEVIGMVTKTFLPNYSEFYEMRQFQPGPKKADWIPYGEEEIPFGPQILFACEELPNLVVSAEVCEDVWSPVPPSIQAALAGATIVVNCSASDETVGKDAYRKQLISGQSARLIAGYVYANAGDGESTTDVVFGGHNIIAENGSILSESERFMNQTIYSEIDVDRIVSERRKNTTFQMEEDLDRFIRVPFSIEVEDTKLTRTFEKLPFVRRMKV